MTCSTCDELRDLSRKLGLRCEELLIDREALTLLFVEAETAKEKVKLIAEAAYAERSYFATNMIALKAFEDILEEL